jgi:hypothetical protein
MPESIYRRSPIPDPTKILQERSNYLKRTHTINGKSSQVRNPAWIKLTGICNKCGDDGKMVLPNPEPNWDTVYKPHFKITPSISDVTIETAGDFMLARKLSATIICYKMEDFTRVLKHFLLPGNSIEAEFGYSVSWGIGSGGSVSNLRVATFNFNTTNDGQWICNFTAVSAGQALLKTDVQTKYAGGLKYRIAGEQESESEHTAYGIATTILADAQKDGKGSIDTLKDGDVITAFQDYNPGISLPDTGPVIKIYDGEHHRVPTGFWGSAMAYFSSAPKNELESANNDIYVSLGYVVNRLVNDQLLRAYSKHIGNKDRGKFSELKIEFDKVLSMSNIGPDIISGDPLSLLILGPGGATGPRGNYITAAGGGKVGKNFEKPNPNPIAVDAKGNLKPWNILLSRWLVIEAYSESVKTKEAQSDSTSLQVQKEETVNLNDFFDSLFRKISDCLGGAVNLTLIEHPKKPSHLLIVDQNFGKSEPIPCFVFNPIDADGSTRTCQIESNVGSAEYQSAMFIGNSKRGDAIAKLRNCESEVEDARTSTTQNTLTSIKRLVQLDGHLGRNHFSGEDIQSLKSLVSSLFHNRSSAEKNEAIHFPGMQMTITLDGVWGFLPGNAISSTQLPQSWRNDNVYFMVTNVSHRFADNDWETTLTGIMAYYNNLKYINL